MIYKNFIAGKWVSSRGGLFHSLNPATEKSLGRFQKSTAKDVDSAVSAAWKAHEKWKSTPAPERGEVLLRIAQLLRREKERLVRIATMEMGKALFETRGDVQEAIDIFEYMAGEGRRLLGSTSPSELRKKACMTIRQPVGVVGLITPWNFPVAIPAWKLSAALVCGNSVVLKPSSDTPLCAVELARILDRSGVPKGVVNLVTGSAEPVGTALVRHKDVRGISFTGSRDTGLWITQNAGIKKVGLELGGKNGIIVMDDADLKLALDGVIWGAFGTTGQRCTACSRVIVHKKIKDKFTKMLVGRAKRIRIGNGLNPKTEMGPLVNKSAQEKAHRYVEIGRREGAKLLCGGKRRGNKGFFYMPTIFSGVHTGMRVAQEEIFGPVLSVIAVKNLDEAVDAMNSIEYGLSSSIYTKDVNSAFEAIERIEAGITYVNASTTGAEVHLPFGGVKQTGSGREAGIMGIDEFSEVKTVYVDYSGRLQRAQIDDK